MEQNFLRLLNPSRHGAGHDQVNRRHALREAAVAAEDGDAFNALAPGLFQRAEDVLGFAARSEGDEDVAFFRQAPDLARKDFVRVIIVADGRHELAVGRERDRGIRPAFLAEKGDVLIALTTSGKSKNILRALEEAKRKGVESIAILGRDGGFTKGVATIDLIVPGTVTARIQEAQKVLFHALCEMVEEKLPKQ